MSISNPCYYSFLVGPKTRKVFAAIGVSLITLGFALAVIGGLSKFNVLSINGPDGFLIFGGVSTLVGLAMLANVKRALKLSQSQRIRIYSIFEKEVITRLTHLSKQQDQMEITLLASNRLFNEAAVLKRLFSKLKKESCQTAITVNLISNATTALRSFINDLYKLNIFDVNIYANWQQYRNDKKLSDAILSVNPSIENEKGFHALSRIRLKRSGFTARFCKIQREKKAGMCLEFKKRRVFENKEGLLVLEKKENSFFSGADCQKREYIQINDSTALELNKSKTAKKIADFIENDGDQEDILKDLEKSLFSSLSFDEYIFG